MRRCKRTKPYVDFVNQAWRDSSGYFAESAKYFYSLDGLRRLKKTGTMVDKGRRKVLMSSDREERELWMKKWGLL